MLNYLVYREVGYHSARTLEKAERSRRTYSLKLSNLKDLASPHQGAIQSLDIEHTEGRYLLCGGADTLISIFDIENYIINDPTGKKLRPRAPIAQTHKKDTHSFGVTSVQWYPHDNGMFCSGSFDCTVKVWDPNTMQSVHSWKLDGKVYSIALSPIAHQHSIIAVGTSDQKGRLCDMRTHNSSHSLIGHREAIWSVKWFPNNEYLLATGSADKSIRFWDIRKAGVLMSLDQHGISEKGSITNRKFRLSTNRQNTTTAHNGIVTGLAFTPDGQFLISTGTDNRMRCWNSSTGENTLVNYPSTKNEAKCGNQPAISENCEVLFHPNGQHITSYRIHTGELISTLQGHFERVNCCTFRPGTEELYSGGSDYLILVWTPPTVEEQMAAQENLSDEDDHWSDND